MAIKDTDSSTVSSRTAQLVKLVTEIGPDVPEIARRLNQFKESVRYRYKEKIVNKGFAVQAAPDHERLGLRRMVLVLEFSEPYRGYAQAIFAAMNELCYLISFAKVLVSGEYVVNLSVPEEFLGSVNEFFHELERKGMFVKVDSMVFESARNATMKAEYFDFDTGRWDFNLQELAPADFKAANSLPSAPCKFDYVDLLIVKELQLDANKSLKEISEKLGINYKKLAWHHATHVIARRMLKGYLVNWMGTRYDYAMDKAMHKKHAYFAIDLLVKDTNEFESMNLREKMSRLPFLWSEASGKSYYAVLALPIDLVVEGLQYLGEATTQVKDRMTLLIMDQTDAIGFSIPYELYDSEKKQWSFNSKDLLERFDKLIMQIKVGGSPG